MIYDWHLTLGQTAPAGGIQIIAEDYSMTQWFDRDLDFDAGGDSTADLASVPRVITSKSAQAHGTGGMLSRKQSKRDLKIAVVERAINQLRYE